MNSIMSSIKRVTSRATGDNLKSNADQTSNTDLMSSAELVAEVAQCATTNQTDTIDKPKVVDATVDLLESVKQNEKFDESQGMGQLIKQGEDYLHQYEKSGGGGITPPVEVPPAIEEKKSETAMPEEEKKDETPTPALEKDDLKFNADQTSNTDLISSAKLLAEAAQCAATIQIDTIDKPKAVDATVDLLESVKHNGKFDETQGMGQFIIQGEDYLHRYEKSGGDGITPLVEVPPAIEEKKYETATPEEEKKDEKPTPALEKDDLKSNADQTSNTDLISSAKLVAEATQCAATNLTDTIDKPKVAGATADLLESVKRNGKFDETQGMGQFIIQGEDYLHQYEKSGGDGITPPVEVPPAIEEKKYETATPEEEKKYETPTPALEKDDLKSNADQTSNTNLISSAKLVAEAAQCAATNQTDTIDKPKVAGATTDLLESFKQIGKFDESQGMGQFIKQGEDFLHQYEKSGGDGTTPPVEVSPAIEEKKSETTTLEEEKIDETPTPALEKKDEAPIPALEQKNETPTTALEKNNETLTPAFDKKEYEVPTTLLDKKDEAPAFEEEKGRLVVRSEEEKGGLDIGDATKAAGSFLK